MGNIFESRRAPRLRIAAIALLFWAGVASSQVFKTQDEALKLAFPDSTAIVRNTLFLDDQQVERIQSAAKVKLDSKVITYYSDGKEGNPQRFAFFERNQVRTKDEVIMIVVNRDGTIDFIEMLAFYEPLDYLPVSRWFDLFSGKKLSASLWPDRKIRNVTGATLTVRSVTLGVRKMLAVFEEIIRPQLEGDESKKQEE